MGIPLVARHHYKLPVQKMGAAGWDALRLSDDKDFGIPRDADHLSRRAALPPFPARAAAIAAIAKRVGAGSVSSYGVGTGVLEAAILSRGLGVVATDFAPATVNVLAGLLPDVRLHDLLRDAPLPGGLHLMHRLDAEFSTLQWRQIFGEFQGSTVLFVPGTVMSPGLLIASRVRGATNRWPKVGYGRTEAALRWLWPGWDAERVEIGELPGYVLSYHLRTG